jgi:hypothetical protein
MMLDGFFEDIPAEWDEVNENFLADAVAGGGSSSSSSSLSTQHDSSSKANNNINSAEVVAKPRFHCDPNDSDFTAEKDRQSCPREILEGEKPY